MIDPPSIFRKTIKKLIKGTITLLLFGTNILQTASICPYSYTTDYIQHRQSVDSIYNQVELFQQHGYGPTYSKDLNSGITVYQNDILNVWTSQSAKLCYSSNICFDARGNPSGTLISVLREQPSYPDGALVYRVNDGTTKSMISDYSIIFGSPNTVHLNNGLISTNITIVENGVFYLAYWDINNGDNSGQIDLYVMIYRCGPPPISAIPLPSSSASIPSSTPILTSSLIVPTSSLLIETLSSSASAETSSNNIISSSAASSQSTEKNPSSSSSQITPPVSSSVSSSPPVSSSSVLSSSTIISSSAAIASSSSPSVSSSSPPLSSSSSSPIIPSSSGTNIVMQAVLNPLSYKMSPNEVPTWQSTNVSPDGTTAIMCNSNCSYSLCTIYRNNTAVFTINSDLLPNIPPGLGSLGFSSISNGGTVIALGSNGCSLANGVLIFEEGHQMSNIWQTTLALGYGGVPNVNEGFNGVWQYGLKVFAGSVLVSPPGDKVMFPQCGTSNSKYATAANPSSCYNYGANLVTIPYNPLNRRFDMSLVSTLPQSMVYSTTAYIMSEDGTDLFISSAAGKVCIMWFKWNAPQYVWVANNVLGQFNYYGDYYPIGISYPSFDTGTDISTSISVNSDNSLFVMGLPTYNGFIGRVAFYLYDSSTSEYNYVDFIDPPFTLPPYSMFGKQVCLSIDSLGNPLLYISAPSLDNPTGSPSAIPFANYTFDGLMQILTYVPISGYNQAGGFPTSYIFLYEYQGGNFVYKSYNVFPESGVVASCSMGANATVFWNMNQNYYSRAMSLINTILHEDATITYTDYTKTYNVMLPYYQSVINPAACPSSRNFYVSHQYGNDANDGLTPDTAWQSANHVETLLLKYNFFLSGDTIFFCKGEVYWQTSLTFNFDPTTAYVRDYANPNGCTLKIASYYCGNANANMTRTAKLLVNSFIPQNASNPDLQWQPYNWPSLNGTTTYPVLKYDLGALQAVTGITYTMYSGQLHSTDNSNRFDSLTVNNNSYMWATHPNLYDKSGWEINGTMYGDNTCEYSYTDRYVQPGRTLTCPSSQYGTPNAFYRVGVGSWCRTVVQALFNGNSTLAYEVIGKTGAWSNMQITGYIDAESLRTSFPAISSGVNNFVVGFVNCTWFMEKYVDSIYGAGVVTMDNPVIDAIPITYEDWYNINQSIPYWEATADHLAGCATLTGSCNLPQICGSPGESISTTSLVYQATNLFTIHSSGQPTYLPVPGAPPFLSGINTTISKTWGRGCPFTLNNPQPDISITKTLLDYPCEMYMGSDNVLYLYPCDDLDRQTLLANYDYSTTYTEIVEDHPVASVQYSDGYAHTLLTESYSHLEFQEINFGGVLQFNDAIGAKFLSVHHNTFDAQFQMGTGPSGSQKVDKMLFYENIMVEDFGSCSAQEVYVVNNTIGNVTNVSCQGSGKKMLFRGNAISRTVLLTHTNANCFTLFTGTIYSTFNGIEPNCTQYPDLCASFNGVQVPQGMITCANEGPGDCDWCSSCNCFLPPGTCTSFQQQCNPNNVNYNGTNALCTYYPDGTVILQNCPGYGWSGIFEYNYVTLFGGISELGGHQLAGGMESRNNEYSNAYIGQSTITAPCGWLDNQYGYSEFAAFVNGNNGSVHDNIFINCTSGGIYSGAPMFQTFNNLLINSGNPSNYDQYHLIEGVTYINNQTWFSTDFVTPLGSPLDMFPYCFPTTHLQYGSGYNPAFNEGYNNFCSAHYYIKETSLLTTDEQGRSITNAGLQTDNMPQISILYSNMSIVLDEQTYQQILYYWGNFLGNSFALNSALQGAGPMWQAYTIPFQPGSAELTMKGYVPSSYSYILDRDTCETNRDNALLQQRLYLKGLKKDSEPGIFNEMMEGVSNVYHPQDWLDGYKYILFEGTFPFDTV